MHRENKYEITSTPINSGFAELPKKHARIYEYALFFYLNVNLLRWDHGKIFERDQENEFNCLSSILDNLIFHNHPAFIDYIQSGLERLHLISKYTQSTLITPELKNVLDDYKDIYEKKKGYNLPYATEQFLHCQNFTITNSAIGLKGKNFDNFFQSVRKISKNINLTHGILPYFLKSMIEDIDKNDFMIESKNKEENLNLILRIFNFLLKIIHHNEKLTFPVLNLLSKFHQVLEKETFISFLEQLFDVTRNAFCCIHTDCERIILLYTFTCHDAFIKEKFLLNYSNDFTWMPHVTPDDFSPFQGYLKKNMDFLDKALNNIIQNNSPIEIYTKNFYQLNKIFYLSYELLIQNYKNKKYSVIDSKLEGTYALETKITHLKPRIIKSVQEEKKCINYSPVITIEFSKQKNNLVKRVKEENILRISKLLKITGCLNPTFAQLCLSHLLNLEIYGGIYELLLSGFLNITEINSETMDIFDQIIQLSFNQEIIGDDRYFLNQIIAMFFQNGWNKFVKYCETFIYKSSNEIFQ